MGEVFTVMYLRHIGSITKSVVLATLFVASFAVLPKVFHLTIESDNLTSVSDTLSSSRLSFYGLLGAGNTVGSSLVTLDTASSTPSTSSSQIASPSAQTVLIGTRIYTVNSIMPNGDESKFTISAGLQSGDTTAGLPVVATQSASHTIKFTTRTAVASGAFRVLVQATSNSGSSNDGIPDGDGFDMKVAAPTVTCPTDDANYDFVTGTATAAATTINGTVYHSFECRYSGSGAASQSFAANPLVITSLINPAPKSTHSRGTADTYKVIVQNLSTDTYGVIDQTAIQIGVVESVRVSATVAPQITFKIAGLTSTEIQSSTGACGTDVSGSYVTTTPTHVPFGEVAISSFTYAGQSLEVSTNAVGGYVVTAQQNDNLGKAARACDDSSFPADCIPDTTGNAGTITYGTKGRWDVTTYKGFGYGLYKISGTGTAAFERDDGDCGGGTFCAKQFADLENDEPAQSIFSSSTVADAENVDVCYKIVVSNTQAAGDYENHIIYTATSTF